MGRAAMEGTRMACEEWSASAAEAGIGAGRFVVARKESKWSGSKGEASVAKQSSGLAGVVEQWMGSKGTGRLELDGMLRLAPEGGGTAARGRQRADRAESSALEGYGGDWKASMGKVSRAADWVGEQWTGQERVGSNGEDCMVVELMAKARG